MARRYHALRRLLRGGFLLPSGSVERLDNPEDNPSVPSLSKDGWRREAWFDRLTPNGPSC